LLLLLTSDTTVCISASWYGALYGFGEVPVPTMKYLEYKDKLEKLGEGLYKKFYKKNKFLINIC